YRDRRDSARRGVSHPALAARRWLRRYRRRGEHPTLLRRAGRAEFDHRRSVLSARSPRARWLWRGVAVLAALPVVLALGVALLLGTGWGRARVLAELLARVNQSIPGQLEVGALERLGPSGLVLADVRLRDPASTPVLALARVSVELAPLELLHGRIVLPRVAL